ncbi:hypothetical protein diail_2618 [Diaporthe ilicicola]|nr:hypothetical protein diail_2618 [Diaporthe ilicicola]
MAPPTIAQLAASGRIQSSKGLNRQEQDELLVWARQQGMSYREIIDRYDFKITEGCLRNRHGNIVNPGAPLVAEFTLEDDELLLRAVECFATVPLDQAGSQPGIWKKVQAYMRENGCTTTAGLHNLKTRWYERRLRGSPLPPGPYQARQRRNLPVLRLRDSRRAAPARQTSSQARPARQFPVLTLTTPARPTAARPTGRNNDNDEFARLTADLRWGVYPPLSREEIRAPFPRIGFQPSGHDCRNNSPADAETEQVDVVTWGDYDPLSEEEMAEVLGSDERSRDQDEDQAEEDDFTAADPPPPPPTRRRRREN